MPTTPLTAAARIQLLLEKGYFPEPLPPCFSTKTFANAASTLPGAVKPTTIQPDDFGSEQFSAPRIGHARRHFRVVNPYPQLQLANEIGNSWADITAHYKSSKFSASQPAFRKTKKRAIDLTSFRAIDKRIAVASSGFRYFVEADVNQCFYSIYTHSISWALHGKTFSKTPAGMAGTLLGNRLDKRIRNCNRKQTVGIPVGPDTSHIIAELVFSTIDAELKSRLPIKFGGFRFVDDCHFYCKSEADAHTILAAIAQVLARYELRLNDQKTRIAPISALHASNWVGALQRFEFRRDVRAQLQDIQAYFELAFTLASRHADENVMKYALKRISSEVIFEANYRVFQSELSRAAFGHPHCLPQIARILTTYSYIGFPLDKVAARRLLESLIAEHATAHHEFEVAWCLWLAGELKVSLPATTAKCVDSMDCSLTQLLALDLQTSRLLAGSLAQTKAQTFTSSSLTDDRWLVAYEAPAHGWLASTAHIVAEPWFRLLLDANVRFYDKRVKLKPLFKLKPRSIAPNLSGAQQLLFAQRSIRAIANSSTFDPRTFLQVIRDIGGYDDRELDVEADED